jgi:hypothetical protein
MLADCLLQFDDTCSYHVLPSSVVLMYGFGMNTPDR